MSEGWIRPRLGWVSAAVWVVGLLLGCGGEDSTHRDLVPPEKITSQTGPILETLFESESAIVRNNAKVAVNALEDGRYVRAVSSIQTIGSLQELSPDEAQTLRKAAKSLEAELRARVEEGDESAKEALELLRGPQR